MSYGVIGCYALYFILVGTHGNTKVFLSNVESDGADFIPWILSILVLRALYSVDKLRPIMRPIAVLVCTTFVLKNYKQLIAGINMILPADSQIKS